MNSIIIFTSILTCALSFGQVNYRAGESRLSPRLLNYQGYLTDTLGNPITNPSISMTFAIFDASSSGNQKWTETQSSVGVDKGIFSVLLGSVAPIPDSVFNNPGRWLQLSIAGQTLSPRTRVVSVPFAYSATYSDTAIYARYSAADNDWSYLITDGADTTLQSGGKWGLARNYGNVMYGNADSTHVNLGVACATGASGQNYKYCTVAGGALNTAGHNSATVAGGYGNLASFDYATIGGGYCNTAGNYRATVAGGYQNTATGQYSTIGGGYADTATADFATIGGGYHNYALSDRATVGGGHYNYATGQYSFVGGGYADVATGLSAAVGGGALNTASGTYGVVAGGYYDTVTAILGGVLSGYSNLAGDAAADTGAAVAGGWDNMATGRYSFVGGGFSDTASGFYSTVAGGGSNQASGYYTTVAGGLRNRATGSYATAAGGATNSASNNYATVAGGLSNSVDSAYAAIAGGRSNTARGTYSFIGGGYSNYAAINYASVGSGYINTASGYFSSVTGGYNNIADDSCAFLGGGRYNKVRGVYSVVCGGGSGTLADSNSAMGKATAIVGGRRNTTDSTGSFIGGGYDNSATANHATVAGGYINDASGLRSAIGGGGYHLASGNYSTVPGGYDNTASGTMSFAAGYKATAAHTGCFVWADSTGSAAFASTAANQFRIRATGGSDFTGNVGIGTLPIYPLHVVGSGTGIAFYSYSPSGRAGYFRNDNNDNYPLYAINSTGSGSTIQGLYVNGHAYATRGFQTFLADDRTGFSMLSQDGELVLSGSSTLAQGVGSVRFDPGIMTAISPDVRIKVIATPSEECNGLYVTGRSINGFTVKELMAGRSNAAFDWIAIIRIKGYEQRPLTKPMLTSELKGAARSGGGL